MSYEMCDCYSSKFPRGIVRSYEHPYEILWYTIWLKKTVPQVGVLRKKTSRAAPKMGSIWTFICTHSS